MCTFENDHRVLVCDVAFLQVREAVRAAFGDAVQLIPVEGAGTRVEMLSSEDSAVFQEVVRAAIAGAQQTQASDQ